MICSFPWIMNLLIYYINSPYLSSLTEIEMATFLASYMCCLHASKSSAPIPFKNRHLGLSFVQYCAALMRVLSQNVQSGLNIHPWFLLWRERTARRRAQMKDECSSICIHSVFGAKQKQSNRRAAERSCRCILKTTHFWKRKTNSCIEGHRMWPVLWLKE